MGAPPLPDYAAAIEARWPGLVAAARRTIADAERAYDGGRGATGSYLWEHTSHVAALSFRLAEAEGLDSSLAAAAALFHDAGKFAGGAYHRGDRSEEEEAAAIAAPLFAAAGMTAREAGRAIGALRALYAAGPRPRASAAAAIAAVVHDADFLSKFGTLGVAQFFIKSTLRGRTLLDAILGPASKELTYAAALPRNMRTAAGRRAAVKKAAATRAYFRDLLGELREAGAADLRLRTFPLAPAAPAGRAIDVVLALPRACGSCGGRPLIGFRRERGSKCETLEAEAVCPGCGARTVISFCLPEIK